MSDTENRDKAHGWLYKIGEIWLRRRVGLRMIDLWESECERKGAIKLSPGESVSVSLPGGVSGTATDSSEGQKGFV